MSHLITRTRLEHSSETIVNIRLTSVQWVHHTIKYRFELSEQFTKEGFFQRSFYELQ